MTTESLVNYLQEMETEDRFIPWDDERHAAKNLETKFDIHPEYAKAIVTLASVSTKQAPEKESK